MAIDKDAYRRAFGKPLRRKNAPLIECKIKNRKMALKRYGPPISIGLLEASHYTQLWGARYGYRTMLNGKLIADEQEQKIVCRALQLRIESNLSYDKIGKQLAAERYVQRCGKQEWPAAIVWRMVIMNVGNYKKEMEKKRRAYSLKDRAFCEAINMANVLKKIFP